MLYILLDHVWDQTGALSEIEVDYNSFFIRCTSGTVTIKLNGTAITLDTYEYIDENVIDGKTFEVSGTGSWKGYLRGII